jgi:hypothetical protein
VSTSGRVIANRSKGKVTEGAEEEQNNPRGGEEGIRVCCRMSRTEQNRTEFESLLTVFEIKGP